MYISVFVPCKLHSLDAGTHTASTITMGNAQSNIVFRKLSKELPNNYWKYTEAGKSVFADDDDREQFICRSHYARKRHTPSMEA